MPITELLEKNCRLYGDEVCLVEINPEFPFICHIIIKRINVKMTFNGIDSIEYSISFRCLPMPVNLQIFCQDLLYLIFHILFHHRFQFRRQSKENGKKVNRLLAPLTKSDKVEIASLVGEIKLETEYWH